MGFNIVLQSFMPFVTSWIGRNLFDLTAEIVYSSLALLSFLTYHLVMEPEALKYTPKALQPQVHNNRRINLVRIVSLIVGVAIIYWFPPISVIVMFIFSALHVVEHLRDNQIVGRL